MKNFRKFLHASMILPATLVIAGCATTNPQSSAPVAGMAGVERVHPSPTADMNFAEKTGYYLGWVSLEALYSFAASNPSF